MYQPFFDCYKTMLFNVSGKEVCDEMEKDCEEAII